MQKSFINSPILCIQATYHNIEIALFNGQNLIETVYETKLEASKNIICAIDTLLKKYSLAITDLACIGANLGPAPFTTLRTTIVTINGIAFATHIPLIGINGLQAFFDEYRDQHIPTVALLQAFAHDVYFATADKQGCANIQTVLNQLADQYPNSSIKFIGNGTLLYQQKIRDVFGDRAQFSSPIPEFCSIAQIGKITEYKLSEKHKPTHSLSPLYLKEHII